jgi:phosphoglycolate phosphatase-like HAD superfamily hydrolase
VKIAEREWGLNLAASLFVGDRETDVKTAKASNMRAVVVSNGWSHAEWQKAEGADAVAPNLIEAIDSFLNETLGEKD